MKRRICGCGVLMGLLVCGRMLAQEPPHAAADEYVKVSAQGEALSRLRWFPQLDGSLQWTSRRTAVAGYESGLLSEITEDDGMPLADGVASVLEYLAFSGACA